MSEATAYREMIESTSDALKARVEEVPAEKLYERPGPHLNTVGWNYWHILRVWDLDINWIVKGQQPTEDAWHRGGYTSESGYDPDGKGIRGSGLGVGYSDAQVDELAMIDAGLLYSYHDMLLGETLEYLDGATDAELRRTMPSPLRPETEIDVASRLQHIVTHTWNHIGELGYAKGMLGMTDQTYPGQ